MSFDWDLAGDVVLGVVVIALLWSIHPAIVGLLVVFLVARYR